MSCLWRYMSFPFHFTASCPESVVIGPFGTKLSFASTLLGHTATSAELCAEAYGNGKKKLLFA